MVIYYYTILFHHDSLLITCLIYAYYILFYLTSCLQMEYPHPEQIPWFPSLSVHNIWNHERCWGTPSLDWPGPPSTCLGQFGYFFQVQFFRLFKRWLEWELVPTDFIQSVYKMQVLLITFYIINHMLLLGLIAYWLQRFLHLCAAGPIPFLLIPLQGSGS